MKVFILILIVVLLGSFCVSSKTQASLNCNVTPEEMQLYFDKGEEYLPECFKNKSRVKQKNNFNLRERGSEIVYYSQPSNDCFRNCMDQYEKCMGSEDIQINQDSATNPSLLDKFFDALKGQNKFQKCMFELGRCLDNCPKESRPPPEDTGGDGSGSGDSIGLTNR